jgi:hypothetical protein
MELVVKKARGKTTYLAVPDKLRFDSPNAYVLATHRKKPFVITNMLYGITTKESSSTEGVSSTMARYEALWLNSVATLAFFAMRQSDALVGGMSRLKISDWVRHPLLDTAKLNEDDRKLLDDTLSALGRKPLRPLKDQLRSDPDRVRLDTAVLRVLGFTEEEIRGLLPELYDAIREEILRPSRRVAKETDPEKHRQTTLEDVDS